MFETKGAIVRTKGEINQADPAKVLYPPAAALEQPFRQEAETLHDVVGLTTEARDARETAFTTMIEQTGIDPYALGAELYKAQTEVDVLDARHEQLSHEDSGPVQPDEEARVIQGWSQETRTRLRESYGQARSEELLARTDKFVKAHSSLQALVRRHGIGSRPDIVEGLVEHVRRVNYR